MEWRVYVSSVIRHKRMVGVIVLLGLAAGFGVARMLKPTYSGQAELWVEVPKEGGGNPGPTWSSQLLGNAGWLDLLRSDVIVVDAIRKQKLYLHPKRSDAAAFSGFDVREVYRPGSYRLQVDAKGEKYALTSKQGTALEGVVGDSVGASLGFLWAPGAATLTPGRKIDFEVASIYESTQKLLDNLVVRPGRERSFINLELRGTDPEVVTATVNRMATHLIEVATDIKREKLTELTKILGDQLGESEARLRKAEAELKGFRTRTATQRVQERDPSASGYLTSLVEQELVRTDREAIERVLAAADAGGSIHALEPIGAVQRAPDLTRKLLELTSLEAELRAYTRRYTEAVPDVQKLSAEVQNLDRSTIRPLARSLASELASRERRLADRATSASQGLRSMSSLPIEDARLSRDVRVAEDLFINLQQRYQEARLAEVSVTSDVRLLNDATVPEKPLYNRAPLAIFLALVGSLGVGVMGAVLTDAIDPKLRYPTKISRELGLPVLGVVPHVGKSDGSEDHGVAPVIEALRGVRLNLLHAHGSVGPVMLTVSSPGMGDGKSFVSSNLALTFADAGYRTLLIDGDIRRGALHRVLNAARKPGLTDFLAGEVGAEAVFQTTAFSNLTFIGSGARRHAGPELLSSAVMAKFINGLRSSYEVVIVDSSPLAAGIDPYALSTLTGNLLLVLRSGVTNRQVAEAKLEILGRLPVRVLGTVVNDVPPGADYEEYSYYLAGYELAEEITTPAGAGRRILPQSGAYTASARRWGN
jgi:tyrosine-protein kinase Etk/Wzc